jgi:hypothetical protein
MNFIFLSSQDYNNLIKLRAKPKIEDEYQKLIVCPAEIETKKKKKIIKPDCSEKILVFSDLGVKYNFGEIIEVGCQLKNPENKHEKFNYIKFLAKGDVYQICQRQKIKQIDEDAFELIGFYKIKTFFYQQILKTKSIEEIEMTKELEKTKKTKKTKKTEEMEETEAEKEVEQTEETEEVEEVEEVESSWE